MRSVQDVLPLSRSGKNVIVPVELDPTVVIFNPAASAYALASVTRFATRGAEMGWITAGCVIGISFYPLGVRKGIPRWINNR